jgi:hypothetical protein
VRASNGYQNQAGIIINWIFSFGSARAFLYLPILFFFTTPRAFAEPDLFDSMISSAASLDMDSPVEAKAEFDPPTAPAGGRVIYRLEVSALDESLTVPDPLPDTGGLALRAGGRGQTYQPSGNRMIRPKTTILFRATVTNAGTYTIPEFQVMAYGKPVKVPATTLTVVSNPADAAAAPPRLAIEPPDGNIYVGQLLKLRLALPVPPDHSVMGMNQPRISGDYIFCEPSPQAARQQISLRGGNNVQDFVQEVQVTPLRAGPQDLIGQAYAYVLRKTAAPPTGGLIINGSQLVNALVDSEPLTINVRDVPAYGRLPGYTGAVGAFHVEMPELSTQTVQAGEPVNLSVRISGDGNLGRILPPTPPVLKDWQAFPADHDNIPPSAVQQRGFAQFNFTLIPLDARVTATPSIPFACFDPAQNAYVDLTIPPVPINVKPNPGLALAPVPDAPLAGPDPEFSSANDDEKDAVLSGLSPKPGPVAHSLMPLQQQGTFWAAQLLPAGLLAGLWIWDRRRRHLAAHPEILLKRRARRAMRRELQLARRAAAMRDTVSFVHRASNALREACAPHIAAHPGSLVCADVLREFSTPGDAPRQGELVRKLFAADDALRFGGKIRDEHELLALRPELESLLEKLKGRLQ